MAEERRERSLGTLTGVLPAAAAFGALCVFLALEVPLLGYPYGVEYTEGIVLDGGRRCASSGVLYPPLTGPPYVRDRAGPLFLWLLAPLCRVPAYGLFAGRALSLLSTLLSACLLTALLYRRALPAAGLLAGGFFLLSRTTVTFGALCRPEPLALCFSLGALAASLRSDRLRFLAFPCAALSLGTAPLTSAALAGTWLSFKQNSVRQATLFGVFVGAVAFFGYVLLGMFLSESLALHLVPCAVADFRWDLLVSRTVLPLAAFFLPSLLLSLWGGLRRLDPPLCGFFLAAWVLSLQSGYETEDQAGLLQLTGASLVLGLRVAYSLCGHLVRRACVIAQAVLLCASVGHGVFPLGKAKDYLETEGAVVAALRRVPGPVLSDRPCFVVAAGKSLFLDPRTWRALVKRAMAKERTLLELITTGYFHGAVLETPLRGLFLSTTVDFGLPDHLSLVVREALRGALRTAKTFLIEEGPARYRVYELRMQPGP